MLPEVSRSVGCDRMSTGQVPDVAFRFESKGVQEEEEEEEVVVVLNSLTPKTNELRPIETPGNTQRHSVTFQKTREPSGCYFCRAFTKLRKATVIFVMSMCPHGTSRLSLGLFS